MNQTQDIQNINTLFAPFGLKVNEVVKGAQSIKYKIFLPLDLNVQGKIKSAESKIKYAIPSAIGTTEFIFGRDDKSIYIEKKSDTFDVVKFESLIPNLPTEGLYLLLGKDDNGNPTYTNLRKAPHILVAGTTGSGKSELLHTFIASLLYRRKQNPCNIVIIDPKRSEFSMYENRNGIKLITEMSEAVNILSQSCDIMEERYNLIQSRHCKDIEQLNDSSIHPIVIVVDELADLLMQDDRAEKYIIRLAQKARACGIHLILGTQSPRRDVITGLIKANIPTKIALKTTNQVESRIILDHIGAETLFGNGDMLYLGNGKLGIIRMQAAYICNETKQLIADATPYEEHKTTYSNKSKDNEWDKAMQWYHEQSQKEQATSSRPIQKTKRLGIIGTFRNLMKVKPIMFQSDEYPPKI